MAATTAAAVPSRALISTLSRRAFFPLPRHDGRPFIPKSLRFLTSPSVRQRGVAVAAAAGGAEFSDDEENAYEVLGTTPLDSFDNMKIAYRRKRKGAEETGDMDYLAKLDKAYDTVMLQQLQYRKKGVTYGSVQEYGEVEGRGIRMAKRVFRALGLIFGSVFAASLSCTTALNLIEFSWQYAPRIVYYYQEMIVTAAASVLVCITASYYR